MSIEDDDWEDDAIEPIEALPGSVTPRDKSEALELSLELITTLARFLVLAGEADEAEFNLLRPRLAILQQLMGQVPRVARMSGVRVGFQVGPSDES